MKNLIFVLLFIFLSHQVIYSQTGKSYKGGCLAGDLGYFSFAIGPSIPIGSFGSKDINNSNAGFANVGSKMELNAGIRLTPVVNLNMKGFYSLNGYDESGAINKLTLQQPGSNWKTIGGSWEIYGLLAGLSYSYPITGKFTADLKALGGVMQTSAPAMTFTSNSGNSLTANKLSSTSFAYQLSFDGAYPLGRLIDLTGSLEYLSSSPALNSSQSFVGPQSGVNIVGSGNSNANQSISIFSMNLGFRVKF
jgi:hypothetical protein